MAGLEMIQVGTDMKNNPVYNVKNKGGGLLSTTIYTAATPTTTTAAATRTRKWGELQCKQWHVYNCSSSSSNNRNNSSSNNNINE